MEFEAQHVRLGLQLLGELGEFSIGIRRTSQLQPALGGPKSKMVCQQVRHNRLRSTGTVRHPELSLKHLLATVFNHGD